MVERASWPGGHLARAGVFPERASWPGDRLSRGASVLVERASWPGGRLARAGVFPKRATGGALCALPFAGLRRAGLESCAVLVHGPDGCADRTPEWTVLSTSPVTEDVCVQ